MGNHVIGNFLFSFLFICLYEITWETMWKVICYCVSFWVVYKKVFMTFGNIFTWYKIVEHMQSLMEQNCEGLIMFSSW
jgi:hypothetical protein